jgi:hypothetical protein
MACQVSCVEGCLLLIRRLLDQSSDSPWVGHRGVAWAAGALATSSRSRKLDPQPRFTANPGLHPLVPTGPLWTRSGSSCAENDPRPRAFPRQAGLRRRDSGCADGRPGVDSRCGARPARRAQAPRRRRLQDRLGDGGEQSAHGLGRRASAHSRWSRPPQLGQCRSRQESRHLPDRSTLVAFATT